MLLKTRRTPYESLASLVTRELLLRIERGELKPGDRLPSERELMQSFGVSRTVVREATSSLRAAGRVATQQGRGAFVLASNTTVTRSTGRILPNSHRTHLDVLDIRLGLETEGAALAARRHTLDQLKAIEQALQSLSIALNGGSSVRRKDREFHLSIARATGNIHLVEIISSILQLTPDKPPRSFPSEAARKQHLQQVRTEHEQIYRAIERRDSDAARAAMRLHLANSRQRTAGLPYQDADKDAS